MKIRGIFKIKQICNGEVIRDFTTENTLTKRGAIHFLADWNFVDATPIQGNPIEDPSTATGNNQAQIRFIKKKIAVPLVLDRDDAIEYRDGVGSLIQGDNLQWEQSGNTVGSIVWDIEPSKGDSIATFTANDFRLNFAVVYYGICVYYRRVFSLGHDNCIAILASVLFPTPLDLHKNDTIRVVYTLDIALTTA